MPLQGGLTITPADPDDPYSDRYLITARIPDADAVRGVDATEYVTVNTVTPEFPAVSARVAVNADAVDGDELSVEDLDREDVEILDVEDVQGELEEYVELEYETRNPSRGASDVVDALTAIDRYGTVDVDVDARGERAVDILEDVPGVVDVYYSEYIQEVTVIHDTLRVDHYDGLNYYLGLEEGHWWIDFDRDHGLRLAVVYRVKPFVPAIEEDDWDEIEEKFRSKTRESAFLPDDSFHRSIIHRDEYTGEREVVTHEELGGDDRHRLAGTSASAEHAYYMAVIRNGDPEDLVEDVFHDLTPEEVEFLVEWAEENLSRERLEEYAVETYAVLDRDPDEITLEDIDDYVPRDERDYSDDDLLALPDEQFDEEEADD